ncbi:MAG: MlaD family protein [Burkholderiaceae bacterium]|nr:MlaD family protein [Burkholderiaceae bacterium]
MENRSHALTTGFFTITLLIAAVLFGLWFNRDRVERAPYVLATTRPIPGLNPQAPVRYRGLQVGKVGSIAFDPNVTGQILITLNINKDAPITRSTFATLGYQGVTGIAFIQLDDDAVGSPRLATNSDAPARVPLRPGLFDVLESRGKAILDQSELVTKKLNTLLNEQNQRVIIGAFSDLSATAQAYRALPEQLQPTLERLPQLADQAQQTLKSFNRVAGNADQLIGQLQSPNGPLARLNNTADHISDSVEALAGELELDTLPQVNSLSDDTRASMRALRKTMNKINDRPQSLIFGAPGTPPGPGEAGFSAPSK